MRGSFSNSEELMLTNPQMQQVVGSPTWAPKACKIVAQNPLKPAHKASILHTFGVQVNPKHSTLISIVIIVTVMIIG